MNETVLDLKIVEQLKPELTSFCYRMLGSIADADDAVQETCIRVWQNRHSFRQQSSLKTWIYRIASNVCIDKLRQAKRRALPVDIFDPLSPSPNLARRCPNRHGFGPLRILRMIRNISPCGKNRFGFALLPSYKRYLPVNVPYLF